jgi:glycosyltransferase involved in cell wall biosynthesis
VATGAVVLLAASALGAVGRLEAPASARFDVAVADFSCRARGKGFVDLVDTSTFVLRSADTCIRPVDHRLTSDDLGWLLHRHRWLIGFLDAERASGDSPFASAHQLARVKAEGLRLLIDGACFGPNETGTQVATREVIRALSERDDVRSIAVTLQGRMPDYAAAVLSMRKVDARAVGSDLGAFGPVDVAYRPFQPTERFDLGAWRTVAPRFLVSILDVIAYANGSYFPSGGEWMAYRSMIERTVAAADAVTVISSDVIGQMRLHGLVGDPTRVEAVPLGTDHLRADVEATMPDELRARGWSASAFAVCIGVNYGHKNRELAIDAHRLLAERGLPMGLVFAGAAVPYGTTRLAESARRDLLHRGDTVVLPEVGEAERNWLLRHASLLWYPSSAEGFGLVPFEAAMVGTPSVAVDFGPIAELAAPGRIPGIDDGYPLLATDWSPGSLAAVAERLLRDPHAARAQVDAVRRAGMHHRWDRHAEALTALFRRVLARPRASVT